MQKVMTRPIRLFLAAVIGAMASTKLAWNEPTPKTFKQFFLLDIRRYFAPLVGTIEGLQNEVRRLKTETR